MSRLDLTPCTNQWKTPTEPTIWEVLEIWKAAPVVPADKEGSSLNIFFRWAHHIPDFWLRSSGVEAAQADG